MICDLVFADDSCVTSDPIFADDDFLCMIIWCVKHLNVNMLEGINCLIIECDFLHFIKFENLKVSI